MHQIPAGSPWDYYTNTNYGAWNLVQNFSWSEKLKIIADNIFSSWISPRTIARHGSPNAYPDHPLVPMLGTLVFAGWFLDVRSGVSASNLFVMMYSRDRDALGLAPCALLCSRSSVTFALWLSCLRPIAQAAVSVATATKVCRVDRSVGSNPLCFSGPLGPVARETLTTKSAGLPYSESDEWGSLQAMYGWISKNTRSDAIIMTF